MRADAERNREQIPTAAHRVIADLRAAATDERRAWDALVHLLTHSVPRQASARLLLFSARAREILRDDPATTAIQQVLTTEFDALIEAAHTEGTLRPDVTAGDIVCCYSLLLHPPTAVLPFERALPLMLDGLRTQPGIPLPGRPLPREDLEFG